MIYIRSSIGNTYSKPNDDDDILYCAISHGKQCDKNQLCDVLLFKDVMRVEREKHILRGAGIGKRGVTSISVGCKHLLKLLPNL